MGRLRAAEGVVAEARREQQRRRRARQTEAQQQADQYKQEDEAEPLASSRAPTLRPRLPPTLLAAPSAVDLEQTVTALTAQLTNDLSLAETDEVQATAGATETVDVPTGSAEQADTSIYEDATFSAFPEAEPIETDSEFEDIDAVQSDEDDEPRDRSELAEDISDAPVEQTAEEALWMVTSKIEASLQVSYLGCNCEGHPSKIFRASSSESELATTTLTLAEMAHYWQEHGVPDVLAQPEMMARNHDVRPDWYRILAGGDQPPALSLESSQVELQQPLLRTYDIDAFFDTASSLAVHRGGFSLSFYPRYGKNASQDTHIIFHERRLDLTKHIYFGQGEFTTGWSTYVVFPNLPMVGEQATTYLTDRDYQRWNDIIVLPALRKICSRDLRQRIPPSFFDIVAKSRTLQQEGTCATDRYQMELPFFIPEDLLDPLWREIQRRLEQYRTALPLLQDAFLVCSHYGCKTKHRAESLAHLRTAFEQALALRFNMNHLDLKGAWVDVAYEDVPDEPGVTLLRKAGCNEHELITLGFKQMQQYQWQMGRDASWIRAAASTQHPLRAGGLSYVQAYNVHKELFATIKKDLQPFQADDFEALPLQDKVIKECYRASGCKGGWRVTRTKLRSAFIQTKQRLHRALLDSTRTSYGIREEYRVQWAQFQQLEGVASDQLAARTLTEGTHRPYWILPTAQVSDFIRWNLNRWLYPIEELTDRVVDRQALQAEPLERQYASAAMAAVLLRSTAVTANNQCTYLQSALWKDEYDSKDGTVRRKGLDYQQSLRQYGIAWLPSRLFNWEQLGILDEYLLDTAFAYSRFRSKFRRWAGQVALDHEFRVFRDLKIDLKRACEEGDKALIADMYTTFYQLMAHSYAAYVLTALQRELPGWRQLTVRERQGYCGLTLELIRKAYCEDPIVSFPRGRNADGRGAHGKQVTDFPNTWTSKVQLLFGWNDGLQRQWDRAPFRERARRCVQVVAEVRGPAKAQQMHDRLGEEVGFYLHAIPRFEKEKLWLVEKANPNNSAAVQAYRRAGGARTKWLLCGWSVDAEGKEQAQLVTSSWMERQRYRIQPCTIRLNEAELWFPVVKEVKLEADG